MTHVLLSFTTMYCFSAVFFLFFFNDPATTEIYTLSLHDALPICQEALLRLVALALGELLAERRLVALAGDGDRKSTRLNSSHSQISYAVFCLKKKNKKPLAALPHCQQSTTVSFTIHSLLSLYIAI